MSESLSLTALVLQDDSVVNRFVWNFAGAALDLSASSRALQGAVTFEAPRRPSAGSLFSPRSHLC